MGNIDCYLDDKDDEVKEDLLFLFGFYLVFVNGFDDDFESLFITTG